MRITRSGAVVAAALGLVSAACRGRGGEAPPSVAAARPEILKDVPKPGAGFLTDTTGTPDAERQTYLAQTPFDTIVAFYRARLPQSGWQVISDRADVPAGKVDLYARRGPQTLWIHVEKQGSLASEYTLIGSAAEDPAARGATKSDSVR